MPETAAKQARFDIFNKSVTSVTRDDAILPKKVNNKDVVKKMYKKKELEDRRLSRL